MANWLTVSPDSRALMLEGSWRLAHLSEISAALQNSAAKSVQLVDGSRLKEIDTASAMLLFKHLSPDAQKRPALQFQNFSEDASSIIALVENAYGPPSPLRKAEEFGFVGKIGFSAHQMCLLLLRLTGFIGETCVETIRSLLQPRFFRLKELFVQLELAGIDAIPIVALVTFLIGIVVAYLFGIQIEKYGANIFIVDAVGLAMCRELSPILVAIIVAGRSGSAFTAQIGTMKLNEEIDAMHTIGLSPMRVLVLPRVFALMIAMPLLVFVGDVVGILGSMVIADLRLGITGVTFLERLHTVIPVRSFMIGLIKAPVFAAFIAVIGCQLGFAVENNARSVGLNTTATVVRSIVAVILLNAAFAVIFVELKM